MMTNYCLLVDVVESAGDNYKYSIHKFYTSAISLDKRYYYKEDVLLPEEHLSFKLYDDFLSCLLGLLKHISVTHPLSSVLISTDGITWLSLTPR